MSQAQREVSVDPITIPSTLLTICLEGAVDLILHEQGGRTQEVLVTFPPEVLANDRVDRGGELPQSSASTKLTPR
jgi:hypothetical protein